MSIFKVFAEDTGVCYIQETSPVLESYLRDNRQIISNIRNELSSAPSNTKNNWKKLITRLYNSLFQWDWFGATFEYYISYSLTNDVPQEVKRDLTRIENQKEGLHHLLESIADRWQWDTLIINGCKNTQNECLYNNILLKNLITKLIEDTNTVYYIYLNSVLGNQIEVNEYKEEVIFLTEPNFFDTFTLHYSKKNALACSQEEGGFWYQINKKISEIKESNKSSSDGFKQWQEAIDLVSWKTELARKTEADGISWENENILQNNYDRYQEESGLSKQNNPISNSFNSLWKSIWEQLDSFNESIQQWLQWDRENIGISEIQETQNYIEVTDDIRLSISEAYQKNILFSTIENDTLEDIQTRIISLHEKLQKNVATFDELKKISTKVCTDQANNKWWNCDS